MSDHVLCPLHSEFSSKICMARHCGWWLPEHQCCAVVGIARAAVAIAEALAYLPLISEQITVQKGYMEGIAEGLRRLGDEIRNK